MYEAVFLEHGGVSIVEAGEAPPSLRCDWSDLQNENKRPKILFLITPSARLFVTTTY